MTWENGNNSMRKKKIRKLKNWIESGKSERNSGREDSNGATCK